MGNLSENFNKNRYLDPETAIERGLPLLSQEQRELFVEFSRGGIEEQNALEVRLDKERVGRIVAHVNVMIGDRTFEPGGERLRHFISSAPVEAMMSRAAQEDVPMDQLVPHSLTESYIQFAHAKTMKFEEESMALFSEQREKDELHFMNELLGYDLRDPRREHARHDQEHEQGRSLSDDFNRSGRGL